MENPTETPVIAQPTDMKSWTEQLDTEVKERNWDTTDLLGEKESIKIEEQLSFNDVPEAERAFYAETASRIALGLMNYSQEGKAVTDNALYEIKRLKDQIGSVPNEKVFLHMLALHLAREANSNTYGNSDRVFSLIITHVGAKNLESSQQDVSEALLNPFKLKDGTELFRFNKETGEPEAFTIEVLLEGTKGLVVFGGGEKGQEDLETFNRKLSSGIYMKRDGSNRLGGLERLQVDTKIDKLEPGSAIKVDVTTPLDKEQKIVEMEVIETNKKELEEKYGNAYLGFIDKFPWGTSPLRIKLKTLEEKVFETRDLRELKIID